MIKLQERELDRVRLSHEISEQETLEIKANDSNCFAQKEITSYSNLTVKESLVFQQVESTGNRQETL